MQSFTVKQGVSEEEFLLFVHKYFTAAKHFTKLSIFLHKNTLQDQNVEHWSIQTSADSHSVFLVPTPFTLPVYKA